MLLDDLCELMTDGSLCAMGGLTPMPVRSALRALPPRTSDVVDARAEPVRGRHDARSRSPTLGTPAAPGRRPTVRSPSTGIAVDGARRHVGHAGGRRWPGVDVPKLCATDSLEAFGSCRLCLVEIDGRKGTPASCTTPCADGMIVHDPDRRGSRELRRGVMELYISDHPLDCLTCPANGDCELQDMAGVVGLRDVRYGYDGENHLDAAEGRPQPVLHLRRQQVHRLLALRAGLRRGAGHVRADHRGPRLRLEGRRRRGDESFMDSECVSCGACVQACPTATLQEKHGHRARHADPQRSLTTCAYCGVGCSFKAELRGDEVVRMVPYKDGGANEGHSCVKGRFAWGYATPPRPGARRRWCASPIDDEWREVSWDEAIAYTARRLQEIQAEHGAGSIGGITSSRCTNEEVYVVQKMVRAAFGNNNVDTCARVCHSPTGYGLKQTFGTSAGTQDFASVGEVRRHRGHRRQPDRRPPGVRLAA